jgi:hypothetical protein
MLRIAINPTPRRAPVISQYARRSTNAITSPSQTTCAEVPSNAPDRTYGEYEQINLLASMSRRKDILIRLGYAGMVEYLVYIRVEC